MNILYLGDSSSWHNALWVKYFCENSEHNVYLFSDYDKQKKQIPLPENIKIIHSSGVFGFLLNFLGLSSSKLRHINKVLSVPLFRWFIIRIINEYDIDVVHCHSLYYGYLGAGIGKNTPVVFTPLGSSIIIHAQQQGYYQKMAREAFKRADLVTNDSLNLQNKGYLVGGSAEKSHIIQFGVDQTLFKPGSSGLREELDIPSDTLLLFSPRAIDALYNIDVILQGLAILKQKGVKFRCMFTYAFGNENYKKLLDLAADLEITEELVWLGFRNYEDMPQVYNAADIVISVPSSDSSPKSVYEAMSCRKPVILSELPWSSEILKSGKDFLGVQVRNSEQIAGRIEELMGSDQKRTEIAENGYQQAVTHFGYHDNMKKMESLMDSLVACRTSHTLE